MNHKLAEVLTSIAMVIVLFSFGIDFLVKNSIGVEETTIVITVIYIIVAASVFLAVFRPIRE